MVSTYFLIKFLQNASRNSANCKRNEESDSNNIHSLSPNISQLCRVCLRRGAIPIFTQNNSPTPLIPLAQYLKTICDIDITAYDNYPQCLCTSCYNTLQAAITLRETAKTSQSMFEESCSSLTVSEMVKKTQLKLDNINQVTLRLEKTNESKISSVPKLKKSLEKTESISEELSSSVEEIIVKTEIDLEEICKSQQNNEDLDNEEYLQFNRGFELKQQEKDDKLKCSEIERKKKRRCSKFNKKFTRIQPELEKTSASLQNTTIDLGDSGSDIEYYLESVKDLETQQVEVQNKIDVSKYFKKVISDQKHQWECQICKKMFKFLSRDHVTEHLPDYKPQHMCDVCGKSFKKYGTFYSHRTLHSNELPFKCKLCPYKGRNRYNLRNHSKVHGQECKFLCTKCPRKFLNLSNFHRHLRKHDEPKFQCKDCGKTFYENFNLKKHCRSQHVGVPSVSCDICGSMFKSRKYLLAHEIKLHNRQKRDRNRAVYLQLVNTSAS